MIWDPPICCIVFQPHTKHSPYAVQVMSLSTCWADLERSGRPVTITDEAKCYVVDIACIKPKDLGYHQELWSINLLREHIKKHCSEKGFPELCNVSKSTVWKILNKREIKPHKIKYYLERTDENFEEHMNNVLMLYKEVSLAIEHNHQRWLLLRLI